jgi:FKBP-type peptidyl-prolyl cis-trans isomerase SlyD
MHDAQNVPLVAPAELSYVHGGYGQLFDKLERALEGRQAGDALAIQLEPEEAFGEYDAELVRLEKAERYGEGLAVGMEIEEDRRIYRVTDVAAGSVVLDGNHPLAGLTIKFQCRVVGVRPASPEEIERGAADDPEGGLLRVLH